MDKNKYQILQIEGLRQSQVRDLTSQTEAKILDQVEKIRQSHPAAADLLRVCAFLQPDTIPEEIFLEGAQHLGHAIQKLATAPRAFDRTIKVLSSHSLIQYNPKQHLLSTDQLVQQVLKEAMDEATYRLWA